VSARHRLKIRNPRGRPKGTHKLPPGYLHDLVRLLDLAFPPPSSFSSGGKVWHIVSTNPVEHRDVNHKCRIIAKRGGVKWIRNGIVVAEITNPKTLRTRLYEAWKLWRTPERLTMKASHTMSHDHSVAGPRIVDRSAIVTTARWGRDASHVLMVGKELHN
jgi:hypothetical protein